MPRLNVIVLDQQQSGPKTYRVALWADVPLARQSFYANVNAKSAWNGATTTDNTNLQAGLVVERVISYNVNGTLAAATADLQAIWNRFQSEITNSNPWNLYGSIWDGSAWTQNGVS